MLTDIVGYTRLMRADEERALQLLEEHNAIVRECIDKHGGFVAKMMGDAFLAEFFDPVHAVSCALDIQVRLQARNLSVPEERKVYVRIGLHYALVTPVGSDIIGDGVNVVSRIEPLSPPGGACLSEALYEKVKEQLVVKVTDLGPQVLKNIDEPVHLYQIDPAGKPKQAGPPSEIDLFTQPGSTVVGLRKWAKPALGAAGAIVVAVAIAVFAARHRAQPKPVPPATPAPRMEEPARHRADAVPPQPERTADVRPPERVEPPKPEAHEGGEHHVASHPSRQQRVYERLRQDISKVEKLSARRQKRVASDLDDLKKIERQLATGKGHYNLDGLEKRLAELERQLPKT